MAPETPTKRVRKPHRNYERELYDLQRYAEISIDVISAINTLSGSIESDFMKGQVAALKAVLKKLGKEAA